MIGQENSGNKRTSLEANIPEEAEEPFDYGITLRAMNLATTGHTAGVAGYAKSTDAQAVHGHALAETGEAVGVAGFSDSPDGTGVQGVARALSGSCWGVFGHSRSPDGIGVQGVCHNGIGVRAFSYNGRALKVDGVASFSTAGAGSVAAKSSSVTVADTRVTAKSHITFTFTDDPGKDAAVVWIARNPAVGFTVNLTKEATRNTPFTYLIVEPS
jgi:hypothetical protein